jgi:hypothetical protein
MPRIPSRPRSFEDQLAAEKLLAEQKLIVTPFGPERDALLQRMRQIDTAIHVNEWLRSPGLRPPD